MHQLKPKYSITIKPSQQTCAIKSILSPNLQFFDISKISIIWYRQPPAPYDIEELQHNFNSPIYKCCSLDYQCVIVCKLFADDGKEVARFDYGPVQTFVYSRLSTSLELRVHVLLFGVWKKCTLALGTAPTLINPQNNNKYQLTLQDIRSIFLKPEQIPPSQQTSKIQPQPDNLSFPNPQLKKNIVVSNLFQRLILLKLFHEIPNKMYCYSTEVLEIAFYDQSSCNTALLAINRFKYQKRDSPQPTKSMYALQTQQLTLTKMMKKSNDSFTQLKAQFPNNGPLKNPSQDTLKKQFLPLSAFTNWRKSPKQSINSANESSIISGNSSKANDSRTSLIQKNIQVSRNTGQNQNKEGLVSKGSSQYRSRVSIKKPKISFLSTDINSTKQRQQKPSFPEGPPVTQTLKSSELIIKPKEFKSTLSLRRSQEQIKTPRMDVDDQVMGLNSAKFPGPVKKKSASQIQVPNEQQQQQEVQEKDQYVNEFQTLLFEAGEDDNKQAEFCLNESFARLEEEEEKQKLYIMNSPVQKTKEKFQILENTLHFIPPPSPTKSQRNIVSLKQTLKSVLQQNYELKEKNQELKKQISETKTKGDKKNQILSYEGQIRKMQQIKNQLEMQIQGLKKSVIMSNSQVVDRLKMQNSWISRTGEKEKMNQSFTRPQDRLNQSPSKDPRGLKNFAGKKPQTYKLTGNQFFPPRQSKAGAEMSFKAIQPSNPTLIARRSQQYDPSNIGTRQGEQGPSEQSQKSVVLTSGDLNFVRFQHDPEYNKFRNNQSYSYKQTQTMKKDERRLPRQYQPYKF